MKKERHEDLLKGLSPKRRAAHRIADAREDFVDWLRGVVSGLRKKKSPEGNIRNLGDD